MGTDVHPVFEKKVVAEDGAVSWEHVESTWDGGRHYYLFGWLANVRNGYGFAGCDTGDGIKPLAEPRGFPEDVVFSDNGSCQYDREVHGEWMGDHSHSWLTSTEILAGMSEIKGANKRGVVSLAEFQAWDGKTPFESYSGGCFGKGIITLPPTSAALKNPKLGVYGTTLNNEVNSIWRKSGRAVRYKKKRVHRMCTDNFSFFTIRHTFGGEPHLSPPPESEMEYKFMRTTELRMKPSRRKHQKKLERYAARAGKSFHVQVEWHLGPEHVLEEFKYFTDEIQRLHDEHGEVRMVFGFDS